MSAPIKLNFKIYKGSTFAEVLRWESSTKVYAPITSIDKSAPVLITAPTHGCPVGWRARVTNVAGMKEINSAEGIYTTVTATTADTLTFNSINALAYTTYTSGGVVEYNQPVDLTGYTARMQVRDKASSELVLLELTTENSKIIIDTALFTIKLLVSATDTAALTFKTGVYNLELEDAQGVVTRFLAGTVEVIEEVTR